MIATTFAATATTSFTVAALAGTPCDGSIPVSWNDMIGHRDYLVRFARRKLQDPALAEDAVHDVFEAVISGRASFAGRAALRSWLTAILKNKIIDVIRQRARYDSFDADEQDDDARQIECPRAQPDELAEQPEKAEGGGEHENDALDDMAAPEMPEFVGQHGFDLLRCKAREQGDRSTRACSRSYRSAWRRPGFGSPRFS